LTNQADTKVSAFFFNFAKVTNEQVSKKIMKVGIMRIILLLTLILLSFKNTAQISYPGKPIGHVFDSGRNVEFIYIPRQFSNAGLIQQNKDSNSKVSYFADNIEVYYTPSLSGRWDTTINGDKIWRIGFYSPYASSIGIIFDSFYLLPGSKLFIYSSSGNETIGAFTYRNNNSNKKLAVTPLYTDSIIVELQLIKNVKEFGLLEIRQIGLGYPSSKEKSATDNWFGTSAACHYDVTCYLDRQLQLQKHAVCRIIYNNSARCTGTLINNTKNDSRPLVLTASHCIKDNSDAETAIFYFDYESPYCNGSDGTNKSLSGSRLLSRSEDFDFSLLELTDRIPVDYNPVFSGWDLTPDNFATSYTIHHPQGDVKKVSVNTDVVINSKDLGANDHYWIIPNYEIGSTEEGSSGSALFDSVFHIRGILSMGGAVCDPYIYDYYPRFSYAWNYHRDSMQQLAYWLNPLSIPVLLCQRHIPSDPLLEFTEQISNLLPNDSLISEQIKNGWGYPTGLNSNGTNEYAEHFYRNGSKYIYALLVEIAKAYTASSKSRIIFKIWDGDDIPRKLIYSQSILLFELNPGETNFIRLDTLLYVNQDFFIGYEIISEDPSDTFAIYYSMPEKREIKNTSLVKKDGIWESLSDGLDHISTSMAIFPMVFNYYMDNEINNPGTFPSEYITLYPNPAKNHIQLLFKYRPDYDITGEIFDLSGRKVMEFKYNGREPNFSIDIRRLGQGIYFVYINHLYGTYPIKFIKIN
jgi:hypothetical protein